MYDSAQPPEPGSDTSGPWILADFFLVVGAVLLTAAVSYLGQWGSAAASARRLGDDLKAATADLAAAQKKSAELEEAARTVEERVAAFRRSAEEAQARAAAADARAKELADAAAAAKAELADARRDAARSAEKAAALEARLAAEQKKLAAAEAEAAARRVEAEAAVKELATARGAAKAAAEELKQAKAAADRLAKERDDLAARVRTLDTRVARLESALGDEAAENKGLKDRIGAYENRFQGLPLKGKRVVFLVDRSGSMGSVSETTPAPEKWPLVCSTVARVMRSIPELAEFQVVAFWTRHEYPLGKAGAWIAYQPGTSAEEVEKALRALKPAEGTNLHVALEEAFRYRDRGLDAVYLFSDGLPTDGPGLSAADRKRVEELTKTDPAGADHLQGTLLGEYVRRQVRERWNAPRAGARVRVESVGFFYESPDLGSFLWALSRENDGNFVGMSKP